MTTASSEYRIFVLGREKRTNSNPVTRAVNVVPVTISAEETICPYRVAGAMTP